MDKRKAHTLCAAVALLVFAALLAMDVWLVIQVRGLREQLELRSTETDNRIAFFRDHVDNQHSLLLERLEQQGSLFSSQSAALDYVGGTVTLTVTVVPRELRQDETLLLTVDGARTADFRPDETGTRWTASAELPLQESYTPVVSFHSDSGRRIQTLDPLSTDELLSVETASCWGGDLYNLPDRSQFYLGLDLDPKQVESLEVVLRESGSNAELARFPMTAAADFPTEHFGESYTFYAADLGDWRDREGHYEVWAELTTSGGLLLTGLNSVGGFSQSGNTAGTSSGMETLRPAWD